MLKPLTNPLDKFVFSPSSLVAFEQRGKCHRKWYEMWVRRSFSFDDTYATRLGRYFEFLCLGTSQHDRHPVTEPELGKSGDVPIAYTRALKQAEQFKAAFTPGSSTYLNEKIIERHLKLTSTGKIKKRGIIDFITENQIDGTITIWDLKLTNDVTSTYGPTPWGNIDDVDPIQLGTYKLLYEEHKGRTVKTKYMVFEYGPRELRRIFDIHVSADAKEEIEHRYEDGYKNLELCESIEWESWAPSDYNCHNCKHICSMRAEPPSDEFTD